MDANRVLNATLNGAASAAAVYLLGRVGGYRFPRAAAALVGTAVGVGSYRVLADVDFEAIEEAVEEAVEEAERDATIGEDGSVDVPLGSTDEDVADEDIVEEADDLDATDEPAAQPRRRTEVLASAVEHAMGFRRTDEEPSD
jgi:hypothetical protein